MALQLVPIHIGIQMVKKIEGTYAKFYKPPSFDNFGNSTYVNGVKDGKSVEWFRNGQKKLIEYIKDGFREGRYNEWHKNGMMKIQGHFKKGNPIDEFTEWYNDGSIKLKAKYSDGYIPLEPDTYRLAEEQWYDFEGELFETDIDLKKHMIAKIDKEIKTTKMLFGVFGEDADNTALEMINKIKSLEALDDYLLKKKKEELKNTLKDIKPIT